KINAGKRTGMVLADCSEVRILPDELFDPALIFEEFGEILFRTELPRDIARAPQACVTFPAGRFESAPERVHHVIDIEFTVAQVVLVGSEDEIALRDLLNNVDSGRGQRGTHAGNHGTTVKADTAISQA